jgi:predicted NBD/HSP70 family sugar kinase
MPSLIESRPVLAFDIGGTWLRWACVDANGCVSASGRKPTDALGLRGVNDPTDLARALVAFIAEVRNQHPAYAVVSVSLGAVYDNLNGVAVSSAPLWGTEIINFPFRDSLVASTDRFTEWHVLNDVSAIALAAKASEPALEDAPFHLITLSSGVAARHVNSRGIPATDTLSPSVQGEIGHLPSSMTYMDKAVHQRCECGAMDHVASFVSGRGFAALLWGVLASGLVDKSNLHPEDHTNDEVVLQLFVEALDAGTAWAEELLDSLSKTVLSVINWIVTLDPGAQIVLTGGFWCGLYPHLYPNIRDRAQVNGPYIIRDDPDWLSKRLLHYENPDGGLLGAAIYSRLPIASLPAKRESAGDQGEIEQL